MELLMFSKHLKHTGDLSLNEAGKLVRELGFDGVDLTVRPGGYVKPENVRSELPEAIQILESQGLSVPMITTAITDSENAHAEEIFKVASENDIQFLKLGYWRYQDFNTIIDRINQTIDDLAEIITLSKKYSVKPSVHIHSGDFITANPAVVWQILQHFDRAQLGAYIDPGHMTVEGGVSGWKQGIDLLGDRIEMVSIKDYGWYQTHGTWEEKKVPLEEGMVDWPQVFQYLETVGFDGPLSFHSEYEYPFDKLVEQTRVDLDFIRDILDTVALSR